MKRPGGERFLGLGHLASRFRAALHRRERQPLLKPVEPGQPNQFKQAMVIYLADRQRLRQQGYLHEKFGEPRNISLADAYHNDLTAISFAATDADTPSAQAVRKAGNVTGVRDHFELFAFARFSPQKEVEIVTRKARELEQHKREKHSKANAKEYYTGEELATAALFLERIGFRFDYPKEGYELARSEFDAAWKAVITKWRERVDQARGM